MIDFTENIDLLEKMVWNFVINETNDEDWLKPSGGIEYLDRKELISNIKSKNFHNEDLSETWGYAVRFFNEYDKIPNKKELKKVLEINNSDIEDNVLEELYNFDLTEYNFDFLYKYVKSFILIRNLNGTVLELLTYLKTTNINPENIDTITERVRNDINDKLSIDFNGGSSSGGLNFLNPLNHIQSAKDGSPTGFKFFDKTQGGGWNEKSLVVFQGRPKVGKSMVLGNIAARSFLVGVNTGIVSVELSEAKYMKRIGANILEITTEEYDTFTNEEALLKVTKKLEEFKASGKEYGELLIKEFPTGGATAIDIENYFIRQEKKMNKKFKTIVVDYLNLLRPIKDNGSGGMYEKIKCISEELRGVAMRNGWCIISATQVKRDAVNDFDLGMDSVAESFGLIHTVDALYGLMRAPLEGRMKIKLIANRDNGYEESYKFFDMHKEYLRLTEGGGPNSEFYSDDEEVTQMEEDIKNSYKDVSNVDFSESTYEKSEQPAGDDYDSLLNSM